MKQAIRLIMTMLVLLVAALPASAQSGDLENHGNKMRYSFSGGTIKRVGDVSVATNNNYITWQEIRAEATTGTTIRGTVRRLSGPNGVDAAGRGPMRVHYKAYKGSELLTQDGGNGRDDCSISYTIPKGVTEVILYMSYMTGGRDGRISCKVTYTVKPGLTLPPAPEPEPEEDCNCDYIRDDIGYNMIDSHIRFNDFYGEVSYRPNWEDDDAYEYAEVDAVLYECYRIRTKEESGAILGLEDMSTYVMKENSELIIRTEDENISKLEMLVGMMWANTKKMAEGKSLEVEMTHCVAGINGTIFACEEKNGVSKVYLFVGGVKVTSKKTKKSFQIKPGQTTSVGKDGKIVVKKFNIEQEAKRLGIPMSDIRNHYNSPTSSTSAVAKLKRYEMERAVVKYKVTQGSHQGILAKAFDKFGQYERRELKIGNVETIALTQGNTSFALDKKTKKAKRTKDADLNFLDMNDALMKRLNLQKKGTATVMGKQCDHYVGTNVEYYVWKGLVMKKVQKEKNGATTIHEVTSIEQPASIDPVMFKMPDGYTVK